MKHIILIMMMILFTGCKALIHGSIFDYERPSGMITTESNEAYMLFLRARELYGKENVQIVHLRWMDVKCLQVRVKFNNTWWYLKPAKTHQFHFRRRHEHGMFIEKIQTDIFTIKRIRQESDFKLF